MSSVRRSEKPQKDETALTQRVTGRSPKQPSPKCCSKRNNGPQKWNGTNVLSKKPPTARSFVMLQLRYLTIDSSTT